MRTLTISLLFSSCVLGTVGCNDDGEDASPASGAAATAKIEPVRVGQIPPPLDLATPPADATRTQSGLTYKTLVANKTGAQPKISDKAMIRYTGWIRRTGATFFTTQNGGQPIGIDLAHAAPGFAEAIPLLHKGEKAVLWLPPSPGTPEAVVYEVELVDIVSPPTIARSPKDGERAKPAAAP